MQNYIQKCDRGQGTVKIHINKLTSVITYIKSSHFDSFIKDITLHAIFGVQRI